MTTKIMAMYKKAQQDQPDVYYAPAYAGKMRSVTITSLHQDMGRAEAEINQLKDKFAADNPEKIEKIILYTLNIPSQYIDEWVDEGIIDGLSGSFAVIDSNLVYRGLMNQGDPELPRIVNTQTQGIKQKESVPDFMPDWDALPPARKELDNPYEQKAYDPSSDSQLQTGDDDDDDSADRWKK